MGFNLSAAPKRVKAAAIYVPLSRNRYPLDQGTRSGIAEGSDYKLVGLALLALFFGALVRSKQSISR